MFFFKQKTAYEMRISDWSSYVCSSDLRLPRPGDAVAVLGRTEKDRHDQVGGEVLAQLAVDVGRRRHAVFQQLFEQRIVEIGDQIGRASCRERVCQYVSISVVAVSIKKQHHCSKTTTPTIHDPTP